MENVSAEADLDRYLPIAGGAEQQFIASVQHERPCATTKLRIVKHRPKKSMGVQQKSHGMYSLKSSR
jgi:hypothetical protein